MKFFIALWYFKMTCNPQYATGWNCTGNENWDYWITREKKKKKLGIGALTPCTILWQW